MVLKSRLEYFNPRAPCGARQKNRLYQKQKQNISTHAPLAGRDLTIHVLVLYILISTHAPLAGRDPITRSTTERKRISTHAPLAGRDSIRSNTCHIRSISTHAPLAGRDGRFVTVGMEQGDFNPRAPCGARLFAVRRHLRPLRFQPTRPLRGATSTKDHERNYEKISTHAPLAGRDVAKSTEAKKGNNFNPRAPCGARHVPTVTAITTHRFQPTRPLRGATRGDGS